MSRATRRRSARDEEPEREDAPVKAPDAGVADLLRLQRTAGNHAVTQPLARNQSGAPPVKDRNPIDDLAKQATSSPSIVSRPCLLSGLTTVNIDPPRMTDSGLVKDGLNLVSLKQANEVPAKPTSSTRRAARAAAPRRRRARASRSS